MAAGTGMQMAAQSQQRRAANNAVTAEMGRQSGFQNQAAQAFEKTAGGQTRESQDDARVVAQANRARAYQDVSGPGFAALPTGGGEVPRVIQNEMSGRAAENAAFRSQQEDALSRLMRDNDWGLQNAIILNRGAEQQGMIENFRRGSMGALPFELQSASNKGKGLEMAGQLTSGAGTLLGLGGALGAFGGGAKSTPGMLLRQPTLSQQANSSFPLSSSIFAY